MSQFSIGHGVRDKASDTKSGQSKGIRHIVEDLGTGSTVSLDRPDPESSGSRSGQFNKIRHTIKDLGTSKTRSNVYENALVAGNPPQTPILPSCPDLGSAYPEGGLRAYSVVIGSFTSMLAGFGLLNTIGTFQAYLSTHQLSKYSSSSIGWIFSLYVFVSFFCGIQIGPVFDAKGPRWLLLLGSVCLIAGVMGLAESTSAHSLSLFLILDLIKRVSFLRPFIVLCDDIDGISLIPIEPNRIPYGPV